MIVIYATRPCGASQGALQQSTAANMLTDRTKPTRVRFVTRARVGKSYPRRHHGYPRAVQERGLRGARAGCEHRRDRQDQAGAVPQASDGLHPLGHHRQHHASILRRDAVRRRRVRHVDARRRLDRQRGREERHELDAVLHAPDPHEGEGRHGERLHGHPARHALGRLQHASRADVGRHQGDDEHERARRRHQGQGLLGQAVVPVPHL